MLINLLKSKTFWSVLGLLGLALYHVTVSPPDYARAWEALMAALAAAGIRHAIARNHEPPPGAMPVTYRQGYPPHGGT